MSSKNSNKYILLRSSLVFFMLLVTLFSALIVDYQTADGYSKEIIKQRNNDVGEKWEELSFKRSLDSSIISISGGCNNGQSIYLSTKNGLYHSINSGETWQVFLDFSIFKSETNGSSNDTSAQSKFPYTTPTAIGVVCGEKETVLLGTDSGLLYVSQENNLRWVDSNFGIQEKGKILSISVSPQNTNTVFLATVEGYIYKSLDGGKSWLKISEVLLATPNELRAITDDLVYMCSSLGIQKSSDSGKSWTYLNGNLPPSIGCNKLSIDQSDPKNIFAHIIRGSTNELSSLGLYISTDGGNSWSRSLTGISSSETISDIVMYNQKGVITLESGDVYTSQDNGFSWRQSEATLISRKSISAIWINPSTHDIMIGSEDISSSTTIKDSKGGELFISKDTGVSWSGLYAGFNNNINILSINTLPEYKNLIVLGTTSGLYISKDAGINWKSINNGISNEFITSVALDETNPNVMLAGSIKGNLYRTEDGGISWVEVWKALQQNRVKALLFSHSDSRIALAAIEGGILLRSSDNGISWDPVKNSAFPLININNFMIDGNNNIYASTDGMGVLKSYDEGKNWNQINKGLSDVFINFITTDQPEKKKLYVLMNDSTIFESNDFGENWSNFEGSIPYVNDPIGFYIKRDKSGFILVSKTEVISSYDHGKTWKSIEYGLPYPTNISSFSITPDNNYYIASNSSIFKGDGDQLLEFSSPIERLFVALINFTNLNVSLGLLALAGIIVVGLLIFFKKTLSGIKTFLNTLLFPTRSIHNLIEDKKSLKSSFYSYWFEILVGVFIIDFLRYRISGSIIPINNIGKVLPISFLSMFLQDNQLTLFVTNSFKNTIWWLPFFLNAIVLSFIVLISGLLLTTSLKLFDTDKQMSWLSTYSLVSSALFTFINVIFLFFILIALVVISFFDFDNLSLMSFGKLTLPISVLWLFSLEALFVHHLTKINSFPIHTLVNRAVNFITKINPFPIHTLVNRAANFITKTILFIIFFVLVLIISPISPLIWILLSFSFIFVHVGNFLTNEIPWKSAFVVIMNFPFRFHLLVNDIKSPDEPYGSMKVYLLLLFISRVLFWLAFIPIRSTIITQQDSPYLSGFIDSGPFFIWIVIVPLAFLFEFLIQGINSSRNILSKQFPSSASHLNFFINWFLLSILSVEVIAKIATIPLLALVLLVKLDSHYINYLFNIITVIVYFWQVLIAAFGVLNVLSSQKIIKIIQTSLPKLLSKKEITTLLKTWYEIINKPQIYRETIKTKPFLAFKIFTLSSLIFFLLTILLPNLLSPMSLIKSTIDFLIVVGLLLTISFILPLLFYMTKEYFNFDFINWHSSFYRETMPRDSIRSAENYFIFELFPNHSFLASTVLIAFSSSFFVITTSLLLLRISTYLWPTPIILIGCIAIWFERAIREITSRPRERVFKFLVSGGLNLFVLTIVGYCYLFFYYIWKTAFSGVNSLPQFYKIILTYEDFKTLIYRANSYFYLGRFDRSQNTFIKILLMTKDLENPNIVFSSFINKVKAFAVFDYEMVEIIGDPTIFPLLDIKRDMVETLRTLSRIDSVRTIAYISEALSTSSPSNYWKRLSECQDASIEGIISILRERKDLAVMSISSLIKCHVKAEVIRQISERSEKEYFSSLYSVYSNLMGYTSDRNIQKA